MKTTREGAYCKRRTLNIPGQLVAMGVALMVLAGNAKAWQPSGWTWWSGSYAIVYATGATYWLNPNDRQWTYGLAPANGWQKLGQSGLASGWSWWAWPYAYDLEGGAWYYLNVGDTQWCVNLETGAWSRLGAPIVAPPPPPAAMVEIPAGSFPMGNALHATGDGNAYNELPVHTVTVDAFRMDRHEVTKRTWDEVRAWGLTNGYTDLPVGGGQASNHPVQMINWFAALKWCNARSQMEGRPVCYTVSNLVYKTGQNEPDCDWTAAGYRLPTEAEWEKAARGGAEGTRFPWTDTDTLQHARANYQSSDLFSYDTSATRGYHPDYIGGATPYTSPVGRFEPNGYGLYDMAGNVWELCWDWYESGYYNYSAATNPRGPAGGSDRIIRGGSWANFADNCRVADRYIINPYSPINNVGFRTVRPLNP